MKLKNLGTCGSKKDYPAGLNAFENNDTFFPHQNSGSGGADSQRLLHTPSTTFRHLPPNSARFGDVTDEALFISAQLFTDAVSALRKVRVLIIVI